MSKAYFFLRDIDTSQVAGDNKREAWMPRSGDGYYDSSARRYFGTKREKRAWLARSGMRECGELYRNQMRLAPTHGEMTKRSPNVG